jgi:hypothetical protein
MPNQSPMALNKSWFPIVQRNNRRFTLGGTTALLFWKLGVKYIVNLCSNALKNYFINLNENMSSPSTLQNCPRGEQEKREESATVGEQMKRMVANELKEMKKKKARLVGEQQE